MSLDASFSSLFRFENFFITKKRNIQICVSCGVTSWYCCRQVCSNSAFIIFIATRNDTQERWNFTTRRKLLPWKWLSRLHKTIVILSVKHEALPPGATRANIKWICIKIQKLPLHKLIHRTATHHFTFVEEGIAFQFAVCRLDVVPEEVENLLSFLCWFSGVKLYNVSTRLWLRCRIAFVDFYLWCDAN